MQNHIIFYKFFLLYIVNKSTKTNVKVDIYT